MLIRIGEDFGAGLVQHLSDGSLKGRRPLVLLVGHAGLMIEMALMAYLSPMNTHNGSHAGESGTR